MSDVDTNSSASVTPIASGRFIRLVRKGRWEYAERVNASGAAALVALTPANKLILIEQPRPAMGGNVIELPAGLVGDTPGQEHEDMAIAAGRELVEETGYEAAKVSFLAKGPSSPGLSSETLAIFLATELTKVGPGGGVEGEQITVHEIDLDQVEGWLDSQISRGLHIDLKVYSGIYFAHRHLQRNASTAK